MERVKEDIGATGVSPKFIWLIVLFIVMVFAGNFIGSFKAPDFGLTYEEMSKEIWLVLLYALTGGIVVLFLGRIKRPALRFGLRLFVAVVVIASARNQLTISMELAPIKHNFALATNECRVTEFRNLSCGKKLQEALAHRDQKLAELGAVMANSDGWRVTAVNRTTIVPNRTGIYFYIPFQ